MDKLSTGKAQGLRADEIVYGIHRYVLTEQMSPESELTCLSRLLRSEAQHCPRWILGYSSPDCGKEDVVSTLSRSSLGFH